MEKQETTELGKVSKENNILQTNLNPNYTFTDFIKFSSDDFAYKAAEKTADNLGDRTNNPLIICSAHGFGKTHLLHAIGNKILKDNPNVKVLYITAEEFCKEFLETFTNKETENFRKKICGLDCLLIDDIQFLSGQEKTSEELFSVIKVLLARRKQIVLSADKSPRQLGFGKNLSAVLMSGMIAEINNNI